MFNNSRNVSISGGNFTSINTRRQKGIDLLRKHIAPGAFHDSSERYDPPKCHPHTRVAVIQAIIDWIEDGQKTSFIKWLYGAAGAGKSAIAQEIAELCHKSGRLAASFFWSRSAFGRNNEDRLITSLAYQLQIAIPQMRDHLEEALENDPSLPSRSLAAQMESLIIQPLEKVFGHDQNSPVDPEHHPKLIILDGLDECGTSDAQRYILKVISHSAHRFPIPLIFLIASRPEQAIRDSFNDQPLLAITARLALDEHYHPDDDIRLFLVDSFQSVKRTHTLRSILPRIWPPDNDIDRLVRKSSGQFIYAATVVKFVRSPRRRPDKQLDIALGITAAGEDTPFAELDALYFQIFSVVEDLPRALEILSCLFLIDGLGEGDSSARQIERILSYASGELQLILIDLHSVLNVPPIRNKEYEEYEDDQEYKKDRLYVLHASLQDFLMDPARSGKFYLDKGKACAGIVQHFLRYIHSYSPSGYGLDPCDRIVFRGLEPLCLDSLVTSELLDDFFGFDFRKWVTKLITFEVEGLADAVVHYSQVVLLYSWIQCLEPNVKKYFGPGRSLYAHHSSSWEAVLDLVCRDVCYCILDENEAANGKSAYTAITHPQIVRHCDIDESAFEKVIGVEFIFTDDLHVQDGDEILVEFQKYLRNPKRAGEYFVDGALYATLSVRIFEFIFGSVKYRYYAEGGDGSAKKDDDNGRPEDDGDTDDEYEYDTRDEEAFEFAVGTLPFYMSNADYMPDLSRHAVYFLGHKIGARDDKLQSKIKLLYDATTLYLKNGLTTSDTPQEQFHNSTPQKKLFK